MDKRENCLKLCLALRFLLVLLLMGNAESRVAVSVLVVVLGLPCIRSPEDYSEPTGSDRFRRAVFKLRLGFCFIFLPTFL